MNKPSAVATARLSARRRCATSIEAPGPGLSTTPMAGPICASDSSSSAYQPALPSHHAAEAKQPSSPASASSACRAQGSPGVQAQKRQGACPRTASTMPRKAPRRQEAKPQQPKTGRSRFQQSREMLGPPRRKPLSRVGPCGNGTRQAAIDARIGDIALITGLEQAIGRARAGAVRRQTIEHDIEAQARAVTVAKIRNFLHAVCYRAALAQPRA